MALPYHPHRGEILICCFDDVAVGAEMIKKRPVIVMSRHDTHYRKLCTVVPLSTTPPTSPKPWHHPLPHLKIVGWQANGDVWAKCDMLSTVSFERLNKPYHRTSGPRKYVTYKLDEADLTAVTAGIRAYFNF